MSVGSTHTVLLALLLLAECIDAMQVPIYDFKLSKRVGYRTQTVPVSRVVIIEGIYSLSARLRYTQVKRLSY